MRVKNVGSTGRGIESSGSQAAAAGSADIGRIVAAASAALANWSQTGPGARRALLLKAADLMESRNAEFEKLMLEEIGATAPWPGFNVDLAAGILRESAALTTLISGEVTPSDRPGVLLMTMRQPSGVVPGIAPWIAPVILVSITLAIRGPATGFLP